MVTCDYCKKEFSSKSMMIRHQSTVKKCIELQVEHGVTPHIKDFNCTNEHCSKTFTSKGSLDYHLARCNFNQQIQQNEEEGMHLSNKIHSLEEVIKEKDQLLTEKERLLKEKDRLLKEKDDLIIKLQKQPKKSPKDKINVRKIDKNLRQLIWSKWIGEDVARYKCLCCKSRYISQFDFECGHVEAVAKGGDDSVDNIRPICKSCNNGMKTMNMMDYIKHHKFDILE